MTVDTQSMPAAAYAWWPAVERVVTDLSLVSGGLDRHAGCAGRGRATAWTSLLTDSVTTAR